MKANEKLDVALQAAVLQLGQTLAGRSSRHGARSGGVSTDELAGETERVARLVRASPARKIFGFKANFVDAEDAVRLRGIAYVGWQMLGAGGTATVTETARAAADERGVPCEQLLLARECLAKAVTDGLLRIQPSYGECWDGKLVLPKATLSWLAGGRKGDFDPVKLDLARLRRDGGDDGNAERRKVVSAKSIYDAVRNEVVGLDEQVRCLASRLVLHGIRAEALRSGAECTDVPQMVIALVGASGAGKSWLASRLAKHSGRPFVAFDSTTLTASGFVGADVDSVYRQLLSVSGNDAKHASAGLILLDEFDKKARGEGRDFGVGTECIQVELLAKLQSDSPFIIGGKRQYDPPAMLFDGRPTGYFLAGVFKGLDETIERLAGRKEIGFSTSCGSRQHVYVQDALKELGFIDELVNRISTVVRLPTPTVETVERAIVPIVNSFNNVMCLQGVCILPTASAVSAISDYCVQTQTYFRGAKSVLAGLADELLFDGNRGGSVLVEPSDVRRVIERLTSGIVQPAPASAAGGAEPMVDGVEDVQAERAAGG